MVKTATKALSTGLTAYTGEWSYELAAHLLRRTLFGPKKSEITAALTNGMEATVASLLTAPTDIPLPVNHNYPLDVFVPIGQVWVDQPGPNGSAVSVYRNQSLRSWIVQRALADSSIQEKMVLFWQNHFGLTFNGNPVVQFMWNDLLRQHALGNFRQFLKEVTIAPAMLVFLNGNQSTANSPNENYGRELLELFSIGKGPQIGEGDYSNYTEDDVRAITRALTGWRTADLNPSVPSQTPRSFFQANRHDTGDKQLSYHFNDQVISDAGEDEYKNVIDIILAELETARYIVREFYRFFVYYDISEAEETNIIEPLAQFFYDSDYDIKATLENLFQSQHFFDSLNRGPVIKDPMTFALSAIRPFVFNPNNPTLESDTIFHLRIFRRIDQIGLNYTAPPSVSGWEAWYQSPVFHRSWINSTSLQQRSRTMDQLTGNGFFIGGVQYVTDWLSWIEELDNPFDPNTLIEESTRILLPQPLYQQQLDALKETLILGLPDFEWTDEYGLYLADPSNIGLANSVRDKLRRLFQAIFNLAEFHLS